MGGEENESSIQSVLFIQYSMTFVENFYRTHETPPILKFTTKVSIFQQSR